jgi:hypothetical protein
MLFDDDFLETLKDDPISGALRICQTVLDSIHTEEDREWTKQNYDDLLEALAYLGALAEEELLVIEEDFPNIGGNMQDDSLASARYIEAVQRECSAKASQMRFSALQSRVRHTLKGGFSYHFSDGDLNRIQTLLNELRVEVAASNHFDKPHQRRLLARLEKLQAELHKSVSDVDAFYGLIGDAGVALGKLGTEAKPLVDRVREIAAIVWRTQARAEELPSDTPLPLLGNNATPASDADTDE